MSATRFLLLAAMLWLTLTATSKAFHYGHVWHSLVHPMPNVTVIFPNGNVEEGALSTKWNGDYRLLLTDGSARVFSKDGFAELRTQPRSQVPGTPRWRVYGPAMLMTALGITLIIAAGFGGNSGAITRFFYPRGGS